MEQLSLFSGGGPFSEVVKEMGVVKASNSLWAGNIGAMVGDLTDIPGSLKLAYELADLHLLEGSGGQAVALEPVKERFLDLQRELSAGIAACFVNQESEDGPSGAVALPLPTETFKLLNRAGAFDDPPPNPKQLGGVVWAPYGTFYREWDGVISKDLEEFRGELKRVFDGFGRAGMEFMHLEAALHEAISVRLTELLERVPQRLEVVFRQRFVKAVGLLEEEVTVEDLERWWEPEEWLGDFIGLLQRSLEAALQFRVERVQTLVETALSFEAG